MSVIPSLQSIQALHRKYAPNTVVFDVVYGHCQIVNEVAMWCASNVPPDTGVNKQLLQAACLLHDIGTYILFDDQGRVSNNRMYPQHAILGAKILADEGLDARIVSCVETHVLLGLSKAEIIQKLWPLPARDYLPQTIEARLLCYADRFHSKHPTFNGFESFLAGLQKDLPLQAAKFKAWSKEFGIPDVEALAREYGQPVR